MNLTETIALVEQQHQKAKAEADALWTTRKEADKTWQEADARMGRLLTCLETLKSLSTPETN